jgi:hypothetical protein
VLLHEGLFVVQQQSVVRQQSVTQRHPAGPLRRRGRDE